MIHKHLFAIQMVTKFHLQLFTINMYNINFHNYNLQGFLKLTKIQIYIIIFMLETSKPSFIFSPFVKHHASGFSQLMGKGKGHKVNNLGVN